MTLLQMLCNVFLSLCVLAGCLFLLNLIVEFIKMPFVARKKAKLEEEMLNKTINEISQKYIEKIFKDMEDK